MPDRHSDDEFFEQLSAGTLLGEEFRTPDLLKDRIFKALTDSHEKDAFFEDLAAEIPVAQAPARLKSRIYSALLLEQVESGPLLSLSECKSGGRALCVFEALVQIAPVGQTLDSINYCRVCHARVLAERMEHAPIYWPGCPYSGFQEH